MDFLQLSVPVWQLVVRALIIYVVFFGGLLLFGKRELGQFTIFDLVLILLVANALQPAITGPDSSVTGGIVIIFTLLLFNRGVAIARGRFPAFDRLIDPPPTPIAEDGNWLTTNMQKQGVSVQDAMMAFREHGVEQLEDVRLACLEDDGSISVVAKDSPGSIRHRRRVRFLRRN